MARRPRGVPSPQPARGSPRLATTAGCAAPISRALGESKRSFAIWRDLSRSNANSSTMRSLRREFAQMRMRRRFGSSARCSSLARPRAPSKIFGLGRSRLLDNRQRIAKIESPNGAGEQGPRFDSSRLHVAHPPPIGIPNTVRTHHRIAAPRAETSSHSNKQGVPESEPHGRRREALIHEERAR